MQLARWLLILWAISVVPASATTYYVSNSAGSDARSCATAQTITTPKQTITSGLACLSAGDTLDIRGGTYAENISVPTSANGSSSGASGSSWPNATKVSAHTGETVWVAPVNGSTVVIFNTGGTALSYQIWTGINVDGTNAIDTLVYIGHDAHHIRWQDSEVKNSHWSGFNAFQGPYIEIKNNRIHDGDARCVGDAGHGIYVSGFTGNTTGADQHGLIEGNSISNYNCQSIDSGVQLFTGSSDTNSLGGYIIRKNWLHDNGVGSFLGDATTVPIQFYNNIVEDNANSGVVLYSRVTAYLYNNTIYSNGDRGIEVGTGGVSSGNLIKNNAVVDNSGAPITIFNTVGTSAATIQFNDFNGNGGSNAVADQNSLSTIGSNITTAPGFMNAAANDFTISSGGNLVNAGTTIAAVVDDYLGITRPQGAAYDIGAHEYASSGATSPIIYTTDLPVGQKTVAYLGYTCAVGGTPPYSWDVSVGTLPSGLSLGSPTSTCVPISGTPSAASTASVTARVTDSAAVTATHAYTFNLIDTSPCSGSSGAWTLINCVGASAATPTSTVTSTAASFVGADFIACAIGDEVAETATPFSDSGGNTWTLAGTATTGEFSRLRVLYTRPTSVSGSHTFTATPSGGTANYVGFVCQGFSGSRASPLDRVSTGVSGTAVAGLNAGSVVTTTTGDLSLVALANEQNTLNNIVTMTGYTVYQRLFSQSAYGVALGWTVVSTASTGTADWRWDNTASSAAIAPTFFNAGAVVVAPLYRIRRSS